MKDTLITIAQRTGYSISTVSRVLGGNAKQNRISKKTIDVILKEAERCNYSPSLLAKSLRIKKTNTIGLMVPSISNPYFADISSVIISEAKKRDYTTIVIDTMEDETIQKNTVSALLSRRVDGIIVVPCGASYEYLEKINDELAPIVLIDRYYEKSTLPYVVTDNYKGGLEATEILINNGHREITCIQGVPDSSPNRRRIAGYLDALKNKDLDGRASIVGNDFSVQNGYIETKLLLKKSSRPTAIFALSNTIALGAIKAIREAGLEIPKDISLISFDNNIYLDFLVPAITRIGQPVDDMAKMAIKLLLDSIECKTKATTQIELSPSVILRNSVSLVSANNK